MHLNEQENSLIQDKSACPADQRQLYALFDGEGGAGALVVWA